VIAQEASVTPSQVSAVAAHRTMRRRASARAIRPLLTIPDETRAPSSRPPHSRSIPLGTDIETAETVVWDPYASSNPHVLILGESGSGKTYTASRLVLDLAHAHLPSIVFDYGQGFSLQHAPSLFRTDVHTIELQLSRDGIAINPLQILQPPLCFSNAVPTSILAQRSMRPESGGKRPSSIRRLNSTITASR
jgi:hypothetical protein